MKRELTIEEIQKISTKILLYIDEVCRENNLKYSIFYGSLIGVERHKGFIPWDDDIDIVMRRRDYNQLIDILSKKTEYLLLSGKTRKNYRYTFAKLVDKHTYAKTKQLFSGEDKDFGVFVDIFPIDGIPSSSEERELFQEKCESFRLNMMDTIGLSYARSYSKWKAIIKLIVRFPHRRTLMKIGNYDYWRNMYEIETVQYPLEKSEYCGFLEWIHINWGVFPVKWFEEYEDVLFEGHKIMAIKQRDSFLKLRYGNYMCLPPENERFTHHPYKFYLK
ncbi:MULTISPECIES: LicD family protein [Enterococcus]|uniref:LicD family protein n=1 Tax=Candidatus Enterococcus murrayae TaxID=2815321 RepID=A0ABS3HLV6_9ENTE|nr:LicD family protein [Enterococcus sp. MJM16]MBO0454298.1 LicD family protein [Enterococcus sp. MJM16]